MVTTGTQNDVNGFSLVFSEPVKIQLMGWSNVLVPTESRPDETLIYNGFSFNVDIQTPTNEASVSFGVKRSNNAVSKFKATYSPVTEKWTLSEITAP
ncbi:hypothetical protein [Sporosarcina sp. ZBG7A]|uniref:hypothetical protein n=1 Tax=Sporosarcina sp. ZBG7A TaxID=1582223 RepID=UPI00057B1CF4|nr:hypothetical protein [Sporosarcina sp. ZBG7A]